MRRRRDGVAAGVAGRPGREIGAERHVDARPESVAEAGERADDHEPPELGRQGQHKQSRRHDHQAGHHCPFTAVRVHDHADRIEHRGVDEERCAHDETDLATRERELFVETPHTLPVDFHSWRRAYSQALADADVNAQRATALAGHASLAAHQRYLANASKVLAIPEAALPRIGVFHHFSGETPDPENDLQRKTSGADGTRTRGLRRDRPAL